MKFVSGLRIIAVLAAVALATPVFAKPTVTNVTISQTAKIGKADLRAGDYKLMIDGNHATVQKGKSVVAESEGRWEDRDSKAAYDSLLIGEDGHVKEVRFSGKTKVFVFSE
ncbi:MAG TPA: hypothetical protein VKF79_11650 [Candidatus Acidoferrum sp.]|nr:hypothetical protein [Candidatus Acidoferrum sp.]